MQKPPVSAGATRVPRNHVRDLTRLIALWDRHSERRFEVSSDRHGTNVAIVSAYVNHAVNLARGVLAMHKDGLDFESISLVRSTMECTVTAAWHVLNPSKTSTFIRSSAIERKKILTDIAAKGFSDDNTALEQIETILSGQDGPIGPESRYLKQRFYAIGGGEQLYLIYRALCTWDHATNSLADAYTSIVERSPQNPWGIELSTRPHLGVRDTHWVATEASLVLRAQIAMDHMLEKPRHKTQLANWARQLGVAADITKAEPQSSGASVSRREHR